MRRFKDFLSVFAHTHPNTAGAVAMLCVVLLWFILALPIIYLAGAANQSSGRIGDTFGILNSFFSALGFAAIAYTLIQQNRTIKQQEADTRIDRFDSKFFQMLQAQREIVNGIDLKKRVKVFPKTGMVGEIVTPERRDKITKGRDCFRIFYNQHFKNAVLALAMVKNNFDAVDPDDLKGRCSLEELVNIFQEQFFPKYQSDLGHYFRHLFHTVKLLENATYIENKKEYIGILRAQLSTFELLLLFYNGLTTRGAEFLPLMIKYDLMKSLNDGLLINEDDDLRQSPYFRGQ